MSEPRCGYLALVGRPNVGKSTLLNALLEERLVITADRPQTTRHAILGIRTEGSDQLLFVDTPGLHEGGRRALNRSMNRAARGALFDVDIVVMVVEAGRWGPADDYVLEQVKQAKGVPVLAINKIDYLPKRDALLPYLAAAAQRHSWADMVPIMAQRGENVPLLLSVLKGHLPPGPHHYDADAITDRSERFLVAELIREKLTRRLGDELPHQLSVEIERWSEGSEKREIHGAIWVERPGQRAIILGHQGSRIKEVGIEARREIEHRFGRPVRLELWVKVRSGWTDDLRALRQLGYDSEQS